MPNKFNFCVAPQALQQLHNHKSDIEATLKNIGKYVT